MIKPRPHRDRHQGHDEPDKKRTGCSTREQEGKRGAHGQEKDDQKSFTQQVVTEEGLHGCRRIDLKKEAVVDEIADWNLAQKYLPCLREMNEVIIMKNRIYESENESNDKDEDQQ